MCLGWGLYSEVQVEQIWTREGAKTPSMRICVGGSAAQRIPMARMIDVQTQLKTLLSHNFVGG